MIEHILIISLIVFAIHYTMLDGEIFGILQQIPLGKLADPIRDCPVCMVPWYGAIICLLLGWYDWPLVLPAALGLNAVITRLQPDKDSPSIIPILEKIAENVKETKPDGRAKPSVVKRANRI